MPDATPYTYRAFGLSIGSDLALPELIVDSAPALPDVTIRCVDALASYGDLRDVGGGGFAGPGRFVLAVRDTADFSVDGGCAISLVRDSAAEPATLRALLLGSAMGALLFQRERVPLHASVVALGDRAVAFLGRSGAGKSTLALAIGARGHAVLGDDLCSPEANAAVSPGVTRLKLWPASLTAAGLTTDGLERVWDGWDKCILPPVTVPIDTALPLAAIIVLDWADDIALDRLGGSAAIEALIVNSFRGRLVEPMGIARAHMERCTALARTVPVWRLTRPRDLTALDAVVERMLAEFG